MTTVASQVSSSCAPSEYPSSEYKKIRVIGSGTTAHVWEATHPFHGTVAVKQFEQRFKFHAPTELGLLSRVQGHPNFPKLFDFWEDHKGSYIAMELMKGDLLS
jgi:serine/threonine protein kinase